MSEASELDMPLSEPVSGFPDLTILKLQRPTARQILANGYPYSFQAAAGDELVAVEHHDAIALYCEACIASTDRSDILDGLAMPDALELRERVLGFFLEAQRKRRGSADSSTSTSSISDGGSPT